MKRCSIFSHQVLPCLVCLLLWKVTVQCWIESCTSGVLVSKLFIPFIHNCPHFNVFYQFLGNSAFNPLQLYAVETSTTIRIHWLAVTGFFLLLFFFLGQKKHVFHVNPHIYSSYHLFFLCVYSSICIVSFPFSLKFFLWYCSKFDQMPFSPKCFYSLSFLKDDFTG